METNNFTKLYNKRQKWDDLSKRIPIEYLVALGITEEMIATAIGPGLFMNFGNYESGTIYITEL